MKFEHLLSRLDDAALQELLGSHVLRLLQLLDPSLTRHSSLSRLLSELQSPTELLRDPAKRNILLETLPLEIATDLAVKLELAFQGNPFPALLKAKLRKNSAKENALFTFFNEIPHKTAVDSMESTVTTSAGYPLFKHQRQATSKVHQFLSQRFKRRVLLHMPTGSGKTRTAMNIIADHLRAHEPTLVVWLAYSEELCGQAADEFMKAWGHLGNREINVYRHWGACEFQLDGGSRDGLLVAGLGKMYSSAMKSINFLATLADRTSLVVIDEAHQATAETYHFVLEFMVEKNDKSALLGLSATPGRTWNDVDEDEKLANFFYKQKVPLVVEGYDNPVEFLIDQGYLARPNFVSLNYSGSVELSPKDLTDLEQSLDIPTNILRRLSEDEQRNLKIVQQVESMAKRHSRILVFATTVDHATLLATVLRARGLHSDSVTGETPKHERSRLIQRYKSNLPETIVLCNYGVLTTGFDAPRTSAAIIARPTTSLVLYSQMVGRAIRGERAGGNPTADIVTVVDQALPGFRDPGEAFTNWEDVWT